jgi:hypothetical protein
LRGGRKQSILHSAAAPQVTVRQMESTIRDLIATL